jgi:hypothetical protein
MHEKPQLREFLLGGLTPTEASELEERMFREDALYRELEEERSVLIEDYATGDLTEEDATRFKEQCDKSPDLAQQVEHFLRLKKLLAQTEYRRESVPSLRLSWSAKWLTPVLATCVGLLIVVIGMQWNRSRRLAQELAIETHQAERHTPAAPSSFAASQLEVVAFLSAEVVRGSQEIPRIEIAPGAQLLQLQIELPRAAVQTNPWTVQLFRNGQEVWRSNATLPRHAGTTTYLPIYLDAESLHDGSYTARLIPDHSGQNEEPRLFTVSHQRK